MGTDIHYAKSGDVHIAYVESGSGLDLILIPGLTSNMEPRYLHPLLRRFLDRLGTFARVISFDKRGTGLSDRVEPGGLQERMDDLMAVIDAAGCKRPSIMAVSESGATACAFAATYPDRVSSLILYGAQARTGQDVGYPYGMTPEAQETMLTGFEQSWGSPEINAFILALLAPSVVGDPQAVEW